MKKLILALALACAVLTGCTTLNPDTGQKEFDPVKTEQVRAAIEPVVASAVRRVVLKNPTQVAYIRSVGLVFCHIAETRSFSPSEVVAELNRLGIPSDPNVADAVNVFVALYKIYYAKRFEAELSPEKWPVQVSTLLCDAIDKGLRDAGQGGVKQ